MSHGSSVSIVIRLWAGHPRTQCLFLGRAKSFKSFPKHLDRFWVHHATHTVGTGGFLPRSEALRP